MRPYWEILNRSFQRTITYKFEAWMGLVSNGTYLALNLAIWFALLQDDQASLSEMLGYTMAVQLLRSFNMPELLWVLPERIRTGEIVGDMLRPISLPLRLAAEQEGQSMYNLLRTVPVYLVVGFILRPELPGWQGWIGFVVATMLGHWVALALALSIISAVFWILEGDSLYSLMFFGIAVFSGQFIPMWYLPDWLVNIASWLPFQAIFYTPAAIFSGRLTGVDMVQAIGVQAVWVLLLGGFMFWIWGRAVRKVVIQGG